MLQLKGLATAALVSVARTAIGTVCTVLASAFLGFMFTQEGMWKRKIWYRMLVVTMYFNAGLIPMFLTMQNLHLTNSFWVYIIPVIVQPFNIILVKTYMESIPKSLQEAAEMDGAGLMTVFIKIILPTATPHISDHRYFCGCGSVERVSGYVDLYYGSEAVFTAIYFISVYQSGQFPGNHGEKQQRRH